MKLTLIYRDCYSDYPFAIHRTGCKDIAKESGNRIAAEVDSIDAAKGMMVDAEMVEMGYSADDVKVFGCCRSA